jgi:hypothetical protein
MVWVRQAMRPAEFRTFLAWERGAGPFWPYVVLSPCAAPLQAGTRLGPLRAARRLLDEELFPLLGQSLRRRAILLDLPLNLSLATAPSWRMAGWVVVPLVPRWPADSVVLPVQTVLAQLTGLAPRLSGPLPSDPRGVVFLLDGERAGPGRPLRPVRRLDNRYAYAVDLFPPAEALVAWGIASVHVVTSNVVLAADLAAVKEDYRRAGLPADHTWLSAPARGAVASAA